MSNATQGASGESAFDRVVIAVRSGETPASQAKKLYDQLTEAEEVRRRVLPAAAEISLDVGSYAHDPAAIALRVQPALL